MRRPSHPPAWYLDPQDPDRIRRWNGRAWTEEIRPIPHWLRTLRLSPGPSTRVPRSGRRLWLASAALLALGGILMAYLGTAGEDEDRLRDREFAEVANARCAQTGAAVVHPNGDPRDGPAEADRIDALATGWEAMVDDLRALPVSEPDAPRVHRWLGAWDRWTSHGRQYADALRRRDEEGIQRILRRSEAENAIMTRFALVNRMDDCLFRTR